MKKKKRKREGKREVNFSVWTETYFRICTHSLNEFLEMW